MLCSLGNVSIMTKYFFSLLLAVVLACGPAAARTTVYTDSSNFGGWADAVNASESRGGEDGVSADIPAFGWIAYSVSPTFTDVSTRIVLTNVTGSGTAFFYVGRSNGAGWFSALNSISVTLTNGVNEITSAALSGYCVSIGGCDIVILQAAGGGTTFAVDRVLARTPEPSAWALMILGFAGVAWRLKATRKKRAGYHGGFQAVAA